MAARGEYQSAALAIACAAALPAAAAPAPLPAAVAPLPRDEWGGELLCQRRGCTTVYATDGEWMLGGDNDDFRDPLTKVSFVPGEEGTFGRVLFGYENWWTEGGMNDQGLFFDGLAVGMPVLVVVWEGGGPIPSPHPDKRAIALSRC